VGIRRGGRHPLEAFHKNALQKSRRSAIVFDMGDKSPKTKNKQAAQKQAKANASAKQKNDNKAAKSVVKPKR
jgi:hypothetical protein